MRIRSMSFASRPSRTRKASMVKMRVRMERGGWWGGLLSAGGSQVKGGYKSRFSPGCRHSRQETY